nr:hypothetical protein [Clostridia bacterium]
MEQKYLNLMEKVLSAYTVEHIESYFDEVKIKGLTEHGFPRLTSNIGILIANGRRCELRPLFVEMMDFCCKSIPNVKAANDFSVREIICCIKEFEKNNAATMYELYRWKNYLATINPETCYNVYAKTPEDKVRNWALFTGVSEFFRYKLGLCDTMEFIEVQIASQLKWLDENGMYSDNGASLNHQPMVYDLVARGLFTVLLGAGYRGRYYDEIDACLKKSALCSLKMQSVTGELAFGGRSNQFIHNEAWLASIFEYEVVRYQKLGDSELAGKFKAAANRALEPAAYWLAKTPISHVKNRYPFDKGYGCEKYAYFNKYMITAASFFYTAHMFCDSSIEALEFDDSPFVWSTSEFFHKIFARAGGYSLEFDTDGDQHYDASGLGRVHKYGAPSAVCMSLPCPTQLNYRIDIENPMPLSLCPGIKRNGEWLFASGEDCTYETLKTESTETSAYIKLNCTFGEKGSAVSEYTVDENGVEIKVSGDGEIAFMLPAFDFDGAEHTVITHNGNTLVISYDGWECRYTTDGSITGTGMKAANRSGHYLIFYAASTDSLCVKISINKK